MNIYICQLSIYLFTDITQVVQGLNNFNIHCIQYLTDNFELHKIKEQ